MSHRVVQPTRAAREGAWSRRGASTALAALALVLTAALAPASTAAPAAAPTATSAAASIPAPDADRGTQGVLPGIPDGSAPLVDEVDTSPTVRSDGTASAAKKPALIKRTANLSMYQSSWDVPVAPGQEANYVKVTQDLSAKKITVNVDFDAAPTAAENSLVWVYLGRWNAAEDSCVATGQGVVIGALSHHTSATEATALYLKDKTSAGTARRSLSGRFLTVTVAGGASTNTGYDCTFAYVDSAPANPAESVPLMHSGAADFRAEYQKAPKFVVSTSELHAAYPKKWNTISVVVRNEGDTASTSTTLRVSAKKSKFKAKTIKLGTIKPGVRKTAKVKIKLTGKSTRTLSLKVSSRGGWNASAKTKVGYRPTPSKVKSLAGRSYWGSKMRSLSGWNVEGLTFVDKRWVYVGVPRKGTPKCSSKIKQCKRYSFNAKKGTFKIGKSTGKVNSERVIYKKLRYTPLKDVKKGARYSAKLSYYDYTGCEGSYTCSTWWQHLTLTKGKKFSWTYEAIHSSGMPPYQTFVSISRPTKKGTYQVLSKSRVKFTYVDAKTGKKKSEIHTVRIDQDALGKHAVKNGLLVGYDPYS